MNRFTKNRILAFFLITSMLIPLFSFVGFSADATEKVFYVDAVNGVDTNNGKTKDTAFKTLSAVYPSIGNDEVVVYIVGEYKLESSAYDNKASHYSGKMSIFGYDENSVLSLTDSSPAFLGGEAFVDNITFKNGSNAYLEARGHKVSFGKNVNTEAYHCLIMGTYAYHLAQKGDISLSSGSYNQVIVGNIAHSSVQTIPGDMKLTVDNATVNMLTVGNIGWASTLKGSTFNGNILLKFNDAKVNNLMVSVDNYDCTFNGAVQIISDPDTKIYFNSNFNNETFAGGKYIVYSADGGQADFVYDQNGKSVAGKVYVTIPKGASATVTNGEDTKTITASGEVVLSEGVTNITYKLPTAYYVDSVNGLDTNNGKTKETAFKSLSAVYPLIGADDVMVYIVGEYELSASTGSSVTPLFSGTLTICGYDENSVLSIKNGNPGYLEGTTKIENIIFKNGSTAYLIAKGHKFISGENVKIDGYHQLVMGSFNNMQYNKAEFEIFSGLYNYIAMGAMAHTSAKTITGDMKISVFGGTVNTLDIGNIGWVSNPPHIGSIFNGNILIKLDGGKVGKLSVASANYEGTYNGAAQVIVNDGAKITIDRTFENKTFGKGKYVVYSTGEGYVDHAYDINGNSVAGNVKITVPEGKYAKVVCGTTEKILEKTGTVSLSQGVNYVTYEDISTLNSIKVSDGQNVYSYPVSDTVSVTKSGNVTLPQKMEKQGATFGGWYSDAAYTTPVKDKSNIEAGTLYAKWIELSENDLYVEGVQIRTVGKEGFRFVSMLTHETRSALIALSEENAVLSRENPDFNKSKDIGYGTVLFPKAYADIAGLTKDAVYNLNGRAYAAQTVPARNTYAISNGVDRYTVVLTDIGAENYTFRYSARPYITYVDASGMIRTVYGESYTANVYDTAKYIYDNGAPFDPEEIRQQVLDYLYENIISKIETSDNPLSNTYRALKYDKKLTVGYLGGSITFGVTATNDMTDDDGSVVKGDIMLSYANRVTTWLEETFPEAEIEYVNAGISDTATNFGNYRLAKDLMNTDGHDMPDVVFVEYTSNDWMYDDVSGKQGYTEFKRQIESLVQNIYSHNPYCDIVFIFSTRGNYGSRPAFIEVANHYGLQYIDMGIPMQELMTARGAANESEGTYYYTVDNLHPSSIGYGIYFKELKKVLEQRLVNEPVYTSAKTNHVSKFPGYLNSTLWLNPSIITASSLTATGSDIQLSSACRTVLYGTSKTQMKNVDVTADSYLISGTDSKITFEFTGTTFSGIFYMTKSGVNMDYTIDGGAKKNFTIDKGAYLQFQMNPHTQLFVIEQELPYGKHTVEITFNPTSDGKVDVQFGGVGVSGVSTKNN